jgi:hypothetical protein
MLYLRLCFFISGLEQRFRRYIFLRRRIVLIAAQFWRTRRMIRFGRSLNFSSFHGPKVCCAGFAFWAAKAPRVAPISSAKAGVRLRGHILFKARKRSR